MIAPQEKDRILGIDFGTVRIGIAITDPLCMFAYPLTTLKNDSKLWSKLKDIKREYSVKEVVLGYPLKESGEISESTLAVEKFKNMLEDKLKVTVHLIDERYSSEIAKERILKTTSSKKKRRDKSLVDKHAAAIILEDYLTELKNGM